MTVSGSKLDRSNGKSKFLYEQIRQDLKSQIESGQWNQGERLPSVSQLMNRFDVDFRTVTAALKLLEKDHYVRLEKARGAGPLVIWEKPSQRKRIIAFAKWCNNPQFVATAKGVQRFAEEQGLDCIILDARQDHDKVLSLMEYPRDSFDGLLIYPWDIPAYHTAIQKAVRKGLKIVFLDRNIPGANTGAVTPDNYGGAYMATKHLLDAQGVPVYYFGMTSPHSSRVDRFHGWAEAMREYDFEMEPYLYELKSSEYEVPFAQRDTVLEKNCEAARELLKKHAGEKISIFGYSGNAVKPIYRAADELGLQIGADLFFAGFMPASFGGNLAVPLTRVLQDDEEVGYEAARMLHQNITGQLKHPVDRILPVKIEIQASSRGIKLAPKSDYKLPESSRSMQKIAT